MVRAGPGPATSQFQVRRPNQLVTPDSLSRGWVQIETTIFGEVLIIRYQFDAIPLTINTRQDHPHVWWQGSLLLVTWINWLQVTPLRSSLEVWTKKHRHKSVQKEEVLPPNPCISYLGGERGCENQVSCPRTQRTGDGTLNWNTEFYSKRPWLLLVLSSW